MRKSLCSSRQPEIFKRISDDYNAKWAGLISYCFVQKNINKVLKKHKRKINRREDNVKV